MKKFTRSTFKSLIQSGKLLAKIGPQYTDDQRRDNEFNRFHKDLPFGEIIFNAQGAQQQISEIEGVKQYVYNITSDDIRTYNPSLQFNEQTNVVELQLNSNYSSLRFIFKNKADQDDFMANFTSPFISPDLYKKVQENLVVSV